MQLLFSHFNIYFKLNISSYIVFSEVFTFLRDDNFVLSHFCEGENFFMFHYIMSLYSPLFTSCIHEMILQTWSYAYVKLTIKKEMTYSTKNTLSSPAATNIHSLMIMFFEGWPNNRWSIIMNFLSQLLLMHFRIFLNFQKLNVDQKSSDY